MLQARQRRQASAPALTAQRAEAVALAAGDDLRDWHAGIPGVAKPEDVYTWLLKCLLHSPVSPHSVDHSSRSVVQERANRSSSRVATGAALEHALMVIGRKWERMDVAAALECLPGNVGLRTMGPCLTAMSTGMMRRTHSCTLQVRVSAAPCHNLCRLLHLAG